MSGALIQSRVSAGYAKAAASLGTPYSQYRATGPASPLAAGNLIATINAAFDSSSAFSFRTPNQYGSPTWMALVNTATVQAGDYLQNASTVFFIAAVQPLMPALAVECNRLVCVTRQAATAGVGAVAYGGMVDASAVNILGVSGTTTTYWPASILISGHGGKNAGLPASAKNGGWKVLLPPSTVVELMSGDMVTDDTGRRFMVDSAELTDLGWRLLVLEVHS